MAKVVKKDKKIDRTHLPVLRNDDNSADVRLSGTAITEAGKLTKHKYFEFLHMDLDDYSDLSFTQEEAVKIRGHLAKMSTGSTAMVPMICSPQCPFRMNCSFYKIGKAPYGRACLVEINLLREWITMYFNEYQVDPNNFTEIGMINELAEIEIYMWRLNQNLARAENAELVTENTVGITREGEVLTEKQLSIFLQAKMTLSNRKSKLIKLMVGDRQEKYKKEAALKIRDDDDPSSSMAELRHKIESLSRAITKKEAEISGKLVDADEVRPAQITSMSPDDLIAQDNGDE